MRSLISATVVRCLDTRFMLASVAEQAGWRDPDEYAVLRLFQEAIIDLEKPYGSVWGKELTYKV